MERKYKRLAGILALAIGITGLAFGDGEDRWEHRRHDRDRSYNYDRDAYRDGYARGRNDASRGYRCNDRWNGRDRAYGDAWRSGYLQGYYNRGDGYYSSDNGYSRDNGYYNGGDGYYRDPRYSGGYYGVDPYQVGYQDGQLIGNRDLRTGHSYRPTKDDKYEDADHGYDRSFGRKDDYKRAYREGYLQGYQQGYGNGGGYRY